MRSSVRQMTIVILLMVLLAPGLLHARTAPVRHSARASVVAQAPGMGFFEMLSSAWNLLNPFLKNGPAMDPNGGVPTSPTSGTSSATTGDNGPSMDPNGGTH